MFAQRVNEDWFNPEILPVERLVFRSDIAAVGLFRCDRRSPYFADSGPIRNHVFVFPRTSVAIRHSAGERFVASPTVVTFYNRGQEYRRFAVEPEQSDDCDWFAVAPDILLEIIAQFDPGATDRPDQPFALDHGPSSAAVYARQRSLIDRITSNSIRSEEIEEEVLAITTGLLASSLRRRPRPATAASRERVEHTKAILAGTLDHPPSLRQLARLTETSVYHLCRIFRRETGFAIHQYRQQLRLRLALDRVARSNDLLDTALSLGFSSHSHFTSTFRKTFGVTPSEFRRTARI